MSYAWSGTSLRRIGECHPLLQVLMRRVIVSPDLPHDLKVLCGHRDEVDQNAAVEAGTSSLRYPNSKHNKTPSLAVDVVPWIDGKASWDWADYYAHEAVVKAVWAQMQAEGLTGDWELSWGGDWSKPHDGPHWELRRS